ncbi:MAG: RNA polymerase sigma factor RpoD [Lachnospiraceae bacterium]|nr:RNA polymerase sigma factor RpoD [Lachnospiraceae bacterium]
MDDKTRKSFEEDLDKFIKKAKKNGVTEYQDVVNVFNKYELTEEEFDLVWNALDKNSIVLSSPVDDAPDSELDEIDEESEEIEKEIEDLDKDSSLDENAAMADSVHMYLKEIGSVELLTMEEEIELAKRIEAGKAAREENEKLAEKIEGLKKARNKEKAAKDKRTWQAKMRANKKVIDDAKDAIDHLTSANLRLVVSNAKHYLGRGMNFLDVIQEGNLGLMRAVDKFDYHKGYKFSTYATWWIRQAITRSIADQARTIRLPVHMVENINRIVRIRRTLTSELGREPSTAEVAARADMDEAKVQEIMRISAEPISLETPVGEEEDTTIGDMVDDKTTVAPEEAAAKTLLRQQIMESMEALDEREREVLILRYGLRDGQPQTLEEVGKKFSVTRERIRQIEARAIKKLKLPSRLKKLDGFI